MRFFVPLETAEPQTDPEFAGMTQVMNIHTRTVPVAETGQYLIPRGIAMVSSNSIILQNGIEKGWLEVLSVVESADEQPEQQAETKKRKKAPVADPAPEAEVVVPSEEQATESNNQLDDQVAPQSEENSL